MALLPAWPPAARFAIGFFAAADLLGGTVEWFPRTNDEAGCGWYARSGLSVILMLETLVDESTIGGKPAVGIIMGSNSDWKTMRPAAEVLDELGVSYEPRVVSAHRTPDDMVKYAKTAVDRGLSLIIAGAGGAAHLPGMVASMTLLPVVGVPVEATRLNGLDALLSIMQMPAEVGVATMSIGPLGADRAARFAAAALACRNPWLRARLRPPPRPFPDAVAVPENPRKVVILAEAEQDLAELQHAQTYLKKLAVPHETKVVGHASSADNLARQIHALEAEGAAVFIAGSGATGRPGGGISFACEIAGVTALPVLGVPIVAGSVRCVDDFLKPFLQMPPGVATFALGRPGAINAALFGATILSKPRDDIWMGLARMRTEQVERVRKMTIDLDS